MAADGGAAFPHVAEIVGWNTAHERHSPITKQITSGGMSLRDYFAGQALTGAFRGGDTDVVDDKFAQRCYELADAMLKAREAK